MKNIRFLVLVTLTIGTLLLSACGGAATPTSNVGGGKVEALSSAFIGIVDSIAGDQWVISGTTVTVDPAVVRNGPFAVGDQVKVEGVVNTDGSFTVSRIEAPTPQDVTSLPPFGNENANDANINDDNANANVNEDINDGNDVNINDDNGNGINSNDTNINDDNGTNTNDDNSNAGAPGNTNTNDNHGGGNGGGGNDNGGGGNGGGGNDNGGGGGNGNGH